MKSRLLILGGLLLFAVAAWFAISVWFRAPSPPAVNLDEADPEVRSVIREAITEVDSHPRDGNAWGQLGLVLLAHGYRDDAAICLTQAEKLSPGEPRWPYALAQTRRYDPAFTIACLQRAADRSESMLTPRLELAEALLDQVRLDEAETVLRQAISRDPGNARARLGLARLAYRREELDSARTQLEELIEVESCKKAARLLLAEVHQRQSRFPEADGQRTAAAKLANDPPWPDSFRAEMYAKLAGTQARVKQAKRLDLEGNLDESRAVANQLEKNNPDVYWLVEARIRRDERDFEAAIAAYRKSIDLRPANPKAQFELGQLLMARQQNEEAAENLRSLISRSPTHGPALLALGECERRLKQPAALDHLRLAVAVMPQNALAHRELGSLLLSFGEKAEAIRHLRNAVKLSPDDAKAKALLENAEKKGD